MAFVFQSEEILNLVREIESIRDLATDMKSKLISDFPHYDISKDARITTFSKFINVANSTQLLLTFIGQHLLDVEWWKQTAKKEIPTSDKNIYSNEVQSFTKLGFVQFIFSSVESGIRLILRAIDSTSCSGGTAEFKSIYDTLLNSKLSVKPEDSIELLDLLRLVRNTIHNNGVYFHRNGSNQTINYKGVQYNFTIGVPVDFVTWEFLTSISKDLITLLDKIFRDQNVSSIQTTIIDPFAT